MSQGNPHLEAIRNDVDRCLFRASPDAVLIVRLRDLRILDVNPAAEELTGLARQHILSMTLRELLASPDADLACGGSSFRSSGMLAISRSGGKRCVDLCSTRLEHGSEPLLLLIVRDTTPLRQAEAKLAAENRALKLLSVGAELPEILGVLVQGIEKVVSGMLGSILLLDETGHLRHGAAPSLTEEYNRQVDGIAIGPKVGSCGTAAYRGEPVIVADIDTDPLWAPYVELVRPFHLRACWSTPILSGTRVLGTFALYYREPRHPTPEELHLIEEMTHVARIAIEHKREEEALLQSERRFRDLFDNCPDAIFVEDFEGHVLDVNPAACRLHGMERAELIGRNVTELVPPQEKQMATETLPRLAGGELQTLEGLSLTRDGRAVPVELRASRISYANRPALLLHVRDISDRKKAEEERHRLEAGLLHSQKLESLGVLAGGIAHDFNNLLTGILGYTDLALRELPPGSPAATMVTGVEIGARRAADLTRQLLAYAGKGRIVIGDCQLSQVVEEMARLLSTVISRKAALDLKLAGDLPTIQADVTQLRQVVMNLLTNASDALEDRAGEIRVATGTQELDTEFLSTAWPSTEAQPGLYVYVRVTDSGCGMSEETMARIFEPFFTTKFTGRGLGLATTIGIVRVHSGIIRVSSTPGQGSTFQVYFPA